MSKFKKSKFHNIDPKDKVAQLSVMVAVNTKLKTDPFLKGNDWNPGNNIDGNEKRGENNKDLIITRNRKQSNNHPAELLDSENITFDPLVNNKNSEGNLLTCFIHFIKTCIESFLIKCLIHVGNITTNISLVSADYDDDDNEEN